MQEEQRLYVIDANIFMQAARDYYSFELAPSFWNALLEWADGGIVISVDKVFQEIKQGRENDPLLEWSIKEFARFFETTQTSAVLQCFADLSQWTEAHDTYNRAAKDQFMSDNNADIWIVAFAKAHNGVVVTFEIEGNGIHRVKIPEVCEAFDIECINTFQMLKELKFQF